MERLKYISTCLFFFAFTLLKANVNKDSVQQPLQIIKGNYKNFSVDNMGNIYLLTTSNQIKKISATQDSLALFNETHRYGNIYSIDVSNPLKILVYYKDYSTVLILDRYLSLRQTIDLRNLNITQVKAIALSYDNNIWLYDEQENTIKKIDENGNIVFTSIDCRLLFKNIFPPEKIIDDNGLLYLYNPQFGAYVFDYYGSYKTKIVLPDCRGINLKNGKATCQDSESVSVTENEVTAVTKRKLKINFEQTLQIIESNRLLYLLKPDGIEIYSAF